MLDSGSQERCSNMLSSWLMVKRISYQSVSVQLLSRVWLSATPWTAVFQASLSITNSWSLFKLMSIESVIPSNHLILCHPLLLLPSIFPSIEVFSSDLALHITWPKYCSFSFSISPSSEYSRLISFKIDWFDLAVQGDSQESSLAPQLETTKFSTLTLLYILWSNSHTRTWLLEKP